jgi:hypothetical protein
MLTLWRRHKSKCEHKDDRYWRKCRCTMWREGTVEGRYERHSLKTRSWERAEEIRRGLEDRKKAPEPMVARVKSNPPIGKQGEEIDSAKLIRQSLMRYGKDKKTVQEKVLKLLSS